MTMQAAGKSDRAPPLGLGRRGLIPNLYDCVIFVLVASALVLLAHGAREMGQPLARLDVAPIVLDPRNLVDRVHAVLLTGGSAYGLAAATGVMSALEDRGIGFPVGNGGFSAGNRAVRSAT